MSDQNFGFGKFVPGFDFLQNLAKGASQSTSQLPNLSSWVAPTLNVEELEKRISELKAVHFWLDQNGKALSATIQALEVQKMTLATLKGMNFNMGEVANSLQLNAEAMFSGMQNAGKAAAAAGAADPSAARKPSKRAAAESTAETTSAAAQAMVDPLQWWNSLTEQFQQIANNAVRDVSSKDGASAASTAGQPKPAKSAASSARKRAAPRKRAGKA